MSIMSICKDKTAGVTGLYTDIQRMCSHDGPGLRTTIFLKGCPLHCTWCHNPETIHTRCDIGWNEIKCIGCRSCAAVCPTGALQTLPERIHIDREKCVLCRACAKECPTGALRWYGEKISPEDAFAILKRDRQYYRESGGGITISGGEPLLQPAFTGALLELAAEEQIDVAVDTTCYASWETIQRLLPKIDILLIDMKLFDRERHKEMTGVENTVILENIKKIARYVREEKKIRIFIRTPLIPGCTADAENVKAIGGFIKEHLEDVLERWELLLFHNMCAAKYKSLERTWKHEQTPMITKSQMKELQAVVDSCKIEEKKTVISGLAVEETKEQ